ncbi:hypothetical protein OAS86_04505 [Gammaproteobacteria bacterium]|nr:hypothetical protein [Gammaproteobacteria bacterium]
MNSNLLVLAGALSLAASIAHVFVIFGGPKWYRIFGAGERMATLAEKKSIEPALITAGIAVILLLWAIYAWAGAGIIAKVPLLKLGLVLITAVYLVRGFVGLIAPYISEHPAIKANSVSFWLWSSVICIVFGVVHLLGLISVWAQFD